MGATNRFSEAAWELQMAFLKPSEEWTQISVEALEKQCAAPMQL
jgi:hypothetical protein